MQDLFRNRKTHYPPTYFLLKKGKKYFLLFWLEHSKDNSLYIWFDDDPRNSWELVAKHNQTGFYGTSKVILEHKSFDIFDPHISWHSSGKIHATGYNKKGRKRERVLSDKNSDSVYDMIQGVTIPISQIILPTLNTKSLKYLGEGLSQIINSDSWMGLLDKKGFSAPINSADGEGFFVVDSDIIPKKHLLGFDISAYWKTNTPNFNNKDLGMSLIYPDSFSINRGAAGTTACLRVFSIEYGDNPKKLSHTVATCFNKDSIDLFQLRKL